MIFGKKPKTETDEDILLRANLAQAIKILYIDRNRLFYPENKSYDKLKETLTHVTKNLEDLGKKKPRMLVIKNGRFDYEVLDKKMAASLVDFLEFLMYLPPPNSILTRWKKTVEVGKMKIPTLSYILHSLLNYKVPDYWRYKLEDYTCISAAIIELLNESSESEKIIDATSRIKKNMARDINVDKTLEYKRKIAEWMRLGLVV